MTVGTGMSERGDSASSVPMDVSVVATFLLSCNADDEEAPKGARAHKVGLPDGYDDTRSFHTRPSELSIGYEYEHEHEEEGNTYRHEEVESEMEDRNTPSDGQLTPITRHELILEAGRDVSVVGEHRDATGLT